MVHCVDYDGSGLISAMPSGLLNKEYYFSMEVKSLDDFM